MLTLFSSFSPQKYIYIYIWGPVFVGDDLPAQHFKIKHLIPFHPSSSRQNRHWRRCILQQFCFPLNKVSIYPKPVMSAQKLPLFFLTQFWAEFLCNRWWCCIVHLQRWALATTAASTGQCCKAKLLLLVALPLYSLWQLRFYPRANKISFFSCRWGPTRCRCRDAKYLWRAQLCSSV